MEQVTAIQGSLEFVVAHLWVGDAPLSILSRWLADEAVTQDSTIVVGLRGCILGLCLNSRVREAPANGKAAV